MNYRLIEKCSVITLIIISALLFINGYKYALGFLLGGLASLLSFKIIERLEKEPINDLKYLKSKLKKNHLLRYLLYALVLLVCFLRNDTFSYITCVIGLLLCKIWIIIIEKKQNKV